VLVAQLATAQEALSKKKTTRSPVDKALAKEKTAQQAADQALQSSKEANAKLEQELETMQASLIATHNKLADKSNALDTQVI
jgi:septal ring factor EnvC (AmiA/AmiB activator)